MMYKKQKNKVVKIEEISIVIEDTETMVMTEIEQRRQRYRWKK